MADEPNTQVDELENEDGIQPTSGSGDGDVATTTTTETQKPDDLRQAMAELAQTVKTIAKPKEDEETPLTDEQKAELWAVYDPKKGRKDFFQKFFHLNPDATPEEVKDAEDLFADMQKGLVRQAVVGSKNIMQIELDKLRKEIGPIMEYVSTARAEATRGRFFKQYEALSDKKYEKIVQGVARTLADKTFASEDEYFKALAEGAAGAIKEIVPEFDLGKTKEKPKPGNTPRLPRTSAGGTGGAGGGARTEAPVATKNQIDELE